MIINFKKYFENEILCPSGFLCDQVIRVRNYTHVTYYDKSKNEISFSLHYSYTYINKCFSIKYGRNNKSVFLIRIIEC